MPEDFKTLWFHVSLIKREYRVYWQDTGHPYTYLTDRDLWCMYLMISI